MAIVGNRVRGLDQQYIDVRDVFHIQDDLSTDAIFRRFFLSFPR